MYGVLKYSLNVIVKSITCIFRYRNSHEGRSKRTREPLVAHQPFKAYRSRDAPTGLTFQQLYALPTLYLCVLYLSENKQRLIGFYNRDEKCLQSGTDWAFR